MLGTPEVPMLGMPVSCWTDCRTLAQGKRNAVQDQGLEATAEEGDQRGSGISLWMMGMRLEQTMGRDRRELLSAQALVPPMLHNV